MPSLKNWNPLKTPSGHLLGKKQANLGKKRVRTAVQWQKGHDELWWRGQYWDYQEDDGGETQGNFNFTYISEKQLFNIRSPVEGKMQVQLNAGGYGKISFVGHEFWDGIDPVRRIDGEDHGGGLFIAAPLVSIVEVFVRRLQGSDDSEAKDRVIMIPGGCVGLSSITRYIPQMIEFDTLNKIDHDSVDPERCDCLRCFRREVDDLRKKKCIDIGDDQDDQLNYSARWVRSSDSKVGMKGEDRGTLHLLPCGIFWESEVLREDGTPKHIYIPTDGSLNMDCKTLRIRVGMENAEFQDEEKDSSESRPVLIISGLQYSVLHDRQFVNHHSQPGVENAPEDVAKLVKYNTSSTSTVACNTLAFHGLPVDAREKIDAYLKEHYSSFANSDEKSGINKNLEGDKSKDHPAGVLEESTKSESSSVPNNETSRVTKGHKRKLSS